MDDIQPLLGYMDGHALWKNTIVILASNIDPSSKLSLLLLAFVLKTWIHTQGIA